MRIEETLYDKDIDTSFLSDFGETILLEITVLLKQYRENMRNLVQNGKESDLSYIKFHMLCQYEK